MQNKAPIYEALLAHKKNRVVPFDVPGHKGGRGTPMLTEFLGENCLKVDVNSMKNLDNLCHPISVIKEAEKLAAKAFLAKAAFFMVGGTTSSVQAMVMTAIKPNDKIILPRNVHRSVINALVICGGIPIYVDPGFHKGLGIPLGMSVESVEKAIKENPDAKAVLVNNPTYYGICSDLETITNIAHKANMLVLADEAHGTHFYFGENLPKSAMSVGADMAAISMHKTGGSLTQSSFLVCSEKVNHGYVRQIINLMQTTSGSYLLLSSLDLARMNLALNGKTIFKKTLDLANYAREEINKIGDYYAFGKEIINNDSVFDFDETKLSIHTLGIGLAGIQVYDILRDEYAIQAEFGDLGNMLAIISSGDRNFEIERLISSLGEIRRRFSQKGAKLMDHEYIKPQVVMTPQKAFYSPKTSIDIKKSQGKISGEFVMCYPPGIPILAAGEKITQEIIEYIAYAKEKGCMLTGTVDEKIEQINIVKE